MGSRKRRRERDSSGRKHRHRSDSRSLSKSRSRSRSPITTPPPPLIASRYERNRDEHEREKEGDRRHYRRHREHRRSPERRRSRERGEISRNDREYHSDSSDVVEVPIAPPAPVISKSKRSPSPFPENGSGDSLSIEETNKLRAKLGLKPLEVESKTSCGGTSTSKSNADGLSTYKDEWGEFSHKPAENLAEKLEANKLRDKFRARKEKRAIDEKLKRVRTLGEEEDVDNTLHWIQRSRDREQMKAEANKRAQILEEMDNQYEVKENTRKERIEKHKVYRENNLKGLRVEHGTESFQEGKTIILTLKDQDVLDDENGDTLVNVNMMDDERYEKNIENKKLNPNQYGYNVYQEEFDQFGSPIERNILSKYDDETGGGKKSSFVIGENLEQEREQRRKLLEIKTKLAGKKLESLAEPLISLASDTYTESELATFKKPKKKVKKLRKKLRAEDLEPLESQSGSSRDYGRRSRHADALETDDILDEKVDYSSVNMEEEDNELEHILSKARRLKQTEALITKNIEVDQTMIKTEVKTEENDDNSSCDHITLNATAEFCRTLGDIPTYGMSGNRDVDANEIMNFDIEQDDQDYAVNEERTTGTWNSVNPDNELASIETPTEMSEVAILDEEPDVGTSVGAALKLALSKGYLEKEENNRPSNARLSHLQAKNYSIEDKTHGDEDKFNRRDRFHSGPVSEFKDKDSYKPNVKLEYIDDNGRLLNEKEAFRYLSHKFHGKGPGKNKIEKRLKKMEQDGLMKKMSSTDTPLGTLTMLQQKQSETHSPYIVLSGNKTLQGSTTITKHK